MFEAMKKRKKVLKSFLSDIEKYKYHILSIRHPYIEFGINWSNITIDDKISTTYVIDIEEKTVIDFLGNWYNIDEKLIERFTREYVKTQLKK